jgi:hypothetical protein
LVDADIWAWLHIDKLHHNHLVVALLDLSTDRSEVMMIRLTRSPWFSIFQKWIHKADEASKRRVVAHLEGQALGQIGEDMKAAALQDGVGKNDILTMHMRFGHTAMQIQHSFSSESWTEIHDLIRTVVFVSKILELPAGWIQ